MGNKSEEAYIRKRKRKATLLSIVYHILRIFPVKNNKIVFTAFEGDGGFCCNPRYIAEELLRRQNQYELVWLVNNMSRQFPEKIHKVRNTFWRRAYHLSTAKIWVDNSRKAYGTAKRKSQMYIQTWHAGIGFKPIGRFRGEHFPEIAALVSKHDSGLIDYVLSNSDWCTRLCPEMLLYEGEVWKTGSPRCDVLLTGREKKYGEIRQRYHIPAHAKIVMFAPTFRGGSQKGKRQVFVEEPTLDFEAVVQALQKRFGGEWYVLLRLHPQLAAQLEEIPLRKKADNMVDVSQADDMNELLAAADAFITDYSSSAFDAIVAYLPVFLYLDDLKEYVAERGKLMWDTRELPYSAAETNEQLVQDILQFSEDRYREAVDKFLTDNGVLEDGHASERVAERIEEAVRKSGKNR